MKRRQALRIAGLAGWGGTLGGALSACAPLRAPSSPASMPQAFEPGLLAAVDAAMLAMIDAGQMPGGALWIEQLDRASYHRAYGQRALLPAPEGLDEATIFDAASLTKAVITAPLVQLLRERGLLEIDAPLQRYLPECRDTPGYAQISLRMLLTHCSGLPAGLPREPAWAGPEAALRLACSQILTAPPGTLFRYSDINFILLGLLVERVSGRPLQLLAREALLEPLGMADSGYVPLLRFAPARIAPTQRLDSGQVLRGEVHDPTARRMGGVAGHAGLFTTTADLARYARMLLAGGLATNGRRVLSEDSVALMSTPQSPPALGTARRGLGFDIDTPYSRPRGTLFPKTSFGHTGFTGCVLWIDPGSRSFYVLLSNRVHPGRPTNLLPLYEELGTLTARLAGLAAP